MKAEASFIVTFFLLYLAYKLFEAIVSFIKGLTNKSDSVEFTQEDFDEALKNKTFGKFKLTEAVVLFKKSKIIPTEGYKFCVENVGGLKLEQLFISMLNNKNDNNNNR